MSPATCLFGRPTRDLLPGIPGQYRPHPEWTDRMDLRERALSRRAITGRARWDEHTQGLSPLKCGDTVLVQNQTGRHPTKWDKTGTVVEVLQYHQYSVRTDGSGRLTTRNRRFLRRYDPHQTEPTTKLPQFPLPANTLPPDPAPQPTQPDHPITPATRPEPPATPTTPRSIPATPATTRTLLATPASTKALLPTQAITTPLRATPTAPSAQARHTPRSYASVTRTPAKPPAPPTTPAPNRPAVPRRIQTASPSPVKPLRRSKRGPKPLDRYGQ